MAGCEKSLNIKNKKKVYVFASDICIGSPQVLLFFVNEKDLLYAYRQYVIKEDIDHSFVWKKSEDEFFVLWKNQSGPIEFCGSGAYALASEIRECEGDCVVRIVSHKVNLRLEKKGQNVFLAMHGKLPLQVEGVGEYKLYTYPRTGIYLLQVTSKSELIENKWIGDHIEEIADKDVHCLCVFYWDEKKAVGHLRYFTPRYGRDEDHVTGSIHQFLTPLVASLYKKPEQEWFQHSGNGGFLYSYQKDDQILITENGIGSYLSTARI